MSTAQEERVSTTAQEGREWTWSRSSLLSFGAKTAVTAIDTGSTQAVDVSFGSLVSMAMRVCTLILSRTTTRRRPIGLCLDNGICSVACQLGILWSGHHFVPLPIDTASIRLTLRRLLDDGVVMVVCAPSIRPVVAEMAAQVEHAVVVLELDESDLLSHLGSSVPSSDAPPCDAEPPRGSRRFCTFHTSGTTGQPKPIHSTYAEWQAFVLAAVEPYRITRDSRVYVATSHVFDPSSGMIFAALAVGATVCLAPFAYTLQRLRAAIELTRATHVCSTPSVWALFDAAGDELTGAAGAGHASPSNDATATASGALDAGSALPASGTSDGSLQTSSASAAGSSLRVVMLGGEPMPCTLIRTWLRRGVTLINTYGTTEATVYQFAYEIPRGVAEAEDHIVDRHARRLGTPFAGIGYSVAEAEETGGPRELILHGVQVGTSERWGAAREASADPGLFRTGDHVRSSEDGGLEFIGRVDGQVKLNGRRIELAPIEAAICRLMHPLVTRTVVLLVDRQLHAFCRVSDTPPTEASMGWASLHAAAVRQLCARELPPYLVPSSVRFLREIPVGPTGKKDAGALTAMVREPTDGAVATAEGETDWAPEGWLRTVASCWAAELGVPMRRLSGLSDFRALSGNSLVALRICSRLYGLLVKAEAGGAFGEGMGVFSPAVLLASRSLEEYAAALQARASADDGTASGGDFAAAPELALSELEELAAQAVAIDAPGLLCVLLRHHTPPEPVANQLLLAAVHRGTAPGRCVDGFVCRCVDLLLQHGASPNAVGVGGTTVLHRAVQHRDGGLLVERLLARRADVMAADANRQTAVHHAARTGGDASCFEMLCGAWEDATGGAEAEVDAAPTAGSNQLRFDGVEGSCREGGYGGHVDVWGRSPLHWATTNGHRDAVVALVGAGSNIWLKDAHNLSVMDLAEKRAACRDWLTGKNDNGGRCDQLTLSMLKLMAAEG